MLPHNPADIDIGYTTNTKLADMKTAVLERTFQDFSGVASHS